MTASPSSAKETPAFPADPAKSNSARPGLELRRIAIFGSVVSTILLIANGFVCATWSHFFGIPGWQWWQLIPDSLALAFIVSTLVGFRISNPLLRIVYTVSASWLGALNFAFFAAAACWIVDGITWLMGSPVPRFDLAMVLFGAAFLATIYGFINARWLRITRVTVALPNLPEDWQGRTVALVTDLHLGHIYGPAFLRRVLAKLRSVRPEAVLISGDMFDGTTVGVNELVAGWREFSAPQGIFYVAGNHDEFADRRIFLDAVGHTGVRVLNNEKVSIDGLQIVGVHDSEAEDPNKLRDILQQARLDPEFPTILLAHRPTNLSVAQEEGISLQLSGHTHQGQMWPWNLLVSRIYNRFGYGLNHFGTMSVYTSSGAGTWGPPVRVGTKSEIVLIKFEKLCMNNKMEL
jgi:predicted MPP superfamily phosphohydrolase